MKNFQVNGHATYNFSIEVPAEDAEKAMEYVMENYTAPEIVDVGSMCLQVEDAELID